jgi:hypothetical protein
VIPAPIASHTAPREKNEMAKQIILTKELAFASGADAGNARMRKAGRSKWNREDYNHACDVQNRLIAHIAPPALVAAMKRDGLIAA